MNSGTLTFAMLSDPGLVRSHNEDACAASPEHGVFVVCDGVGGAASGEVASRIAADTLLSQVISARVSNISLELALEGAIEHVNRLVFRQARQTAAQRGMATTLVALAVEPPADSANTPAISPVTIWLANVGDSRCYRLREGRIEQLTRDHSIVEEQVRSGEMTRAQASVSPIRNVITRAIGSEASVDPDIQQLPGCSGDLYLLCSDGLTRDLSDEEIAAILHAESDATNDALTTACERLIRAANQRGGGDNITCLLVSVL